MTIIIVLEKTRNRVWDYPFEYELLMVMQPWLLFQVIAISYVNTVRPL